ncbi:hypothetical protein KC872_03710 [Candidatus Kaiserbacteria bacterium]|nr:hypothetical protein [Candidatus Kaiserbacteria bacterium]
MFSEVNLWVMTIIFFFVFLSLIMPLIKEFNEVHKPNKHPSAAAENTVKAFILSLALAISGLLTVTFTILGLINQ